MCKAAALSTVALTLLTGLSCLGLKLPSVEVAATKSQIFPAFWSSGPVFTIAITPRCISGFKYAAGLDHKPQSCSVKRLFDIPAKKTAFRQFYYKTSDITLWKNS